MQYNEKEKTGEELGLVRLYEWTHYSKKRKGWINDEAEIRYNNLKLREDEAKTDGTGPLTDEQLSIDVLGFKSGYLRGLGRGAKPSMSFSGKRSRAQLERDAQEARREVEEQRKINAELVSRLQSVESKSMETNAKLDLLLEQLGRAGIPMTL